MTLEDPTPDEFDVILEATPAEVEVMQEDSVRLVPEVATDLIVNESVARAIANGTPLRVIADQLGVSVQAITRRMRTLPMKDLMAREAKRIIRHLATRDLGKEKYLGIATALGILVDKVQRIENEPTESTRFIDQKTLEDIKVGLFGRPAGTGREGSSIESADAPRGIPESVHESPPE